MSNEQIKGDLAVGRNLHAGGDATVSGSARVKGSLKIDGWLDAPNIKQSNKGLFKDEPSLKSAYPKPQRGWYALVGATLPASVYIVNEYGAWVATGATSSDLKVDLTGYVSKEELDEKGYATTDEVAKIKDLAPLVEETAGYVFEVRDSGGRALLSVRGDGEVEFGAGVPPQILQRLRIAVAPVVRGLSEVAQAVGSVEQVVGSVEHPDYVWALVDKEGRQLMAITRDGEVEFGVGVPEIIKRYVSLRLSPIKNVIATISMTIDETGADVTELKGTVNKGDISGNIFTLLDADMKPVLAIDGKGVLHPAGLSLPETTTAEIKGMMRRAGTDLSGYEHIELPMPTVLCRVDLLCPFSLNDSYLASNTLRCRARFTGMGYAFEKPVDLEWQGSSSRNFPRKNLAITWLNEDGEDCDVRFGSMIATSDYHLKANFIDATQSRNVCSCRLYEQMQQTRSYPRRPWQEVTGADVTHARLLFDNGAMGHIDGFPVEVYHNGEYWGLFTMNLKKDRKNFRMEKKNQNEIILELGGGVNSNNSWDNFSWADYEVRNPKVDNAAGGDYVEGDVPETCEMKQSVEDWFTWLNSVSEEDFKAQAQERMFIPQMIDYMLLMTVINNGDCWTRNGLFCSWDGYRFTLMPYDMDGVFGLNGYGLKNDNASAVWLLSNWENGTTTSGCDLVYGRIYRQFKEELISRYAELRDKGIFTVENITGLFEAMGRQIGTEAYERWFEAYRYDDGTCMIPSHRPEGSVVPDEYKNAFNQDGGWFTSVTQINEWLKVRFEALDKVFGYNQ